MKDQLHSFIGAFGTAIPLKQLVSNLVNDSLPTANHNNTIVVNEVEQGIALGTNMQHAIGIMGDILTTLVINSSKGDIHITAEKFRDIITLEFQERNNYNGYALAYSIGSIEPVAYSIGGHIFMKGPQKKVTTIYFSFPLNPLAA